MTDGNQPVESDDSTINLWQLWLDIPCTAGWISWHKWIWAANPLSRLIPLDPEDIWRAFVNLGDGFSRHTEVFQENIAGLLQQYSDLHLWMLKK